jgi:hypothetical protein
MTAFEGEGMKPEASKQRLLKGLGIASLSPCCCFGMFCGCC